MGGGGVVHPTLVSHGRRCIDNSQRCTGLCNIGFGQRNHSRWRCTEATGARGSVDAVLWGDVALHHPRSRRPCARYVTSPKCRPSSVAVPTTTAARGSAPAQRSELSQVQLPTAAHCSSTTLHIPAVHAALCHLVRRRAEMALLWVLRSAWWMTMAALSVLRGVLSV